MKERWGRGYRTSKQILNLVVDIFFTKTHEPAVGYKMSFNPVVRPFETTWLPRKQVEKVHTSSGRMPALLRQNSLDLELIDEQDVYQVVGLDLKPC